MPEDAIGEALLELEQRLLEPQVRRNRSSVAALLADDFVEFGSSGRTFDKQQTLELLGSGAEVQLELIGFRARSLGSGVVLVTYRAMRREGPSGPGAESLRSSIWRLSEGRWQMLFHQGTPVPVRTREGQAPQQGG